LNNDTSNELLWMDEILAKKAAEEPKIVEKREEPAQSPVPVNDAKSSPAAQDDMEGSLMIFGIIGILFVAIMCIMFRIMFRCTKDPRQQKREKKYQKILNA